jgi:hypothetical protein
MSLIHSFFPSLSLWIFQGGIRPSPAMGNPSYQFFRISARNYNPVSSREGEKTGDILCRGPGFRLRPIAGGKHRPIELRISDCGVFFSNPQSEIEGPFAVDPGTSFPYT